MLVSKNLPFMPMHQWQDIFVFERKVKAWLYRCKWFSFDIDERLSSVLLGVTRSIWHRKLVLKEFLRFKNEISSLFFILSNLFSQSSFKRKIKFSIFFSWKTFRQWNINLMMMKITFSVVEFSSRSLSCSIIIEEKHQSSSFFSFCTHTNRINWFAYRSVFSSLYLFSN